MASFVVRDGRVRALVRRAGVTRCATFGSKAAARDWAAKVERELSELKATGVMQPRDVTLGDLIDRYIAELYPRKPWGRSKSADLARLKRDLGNRPATSLTSFSLIEYFRRRQDAGAGPVVVGAQVGYLVGVLTVARTVWHLDVPLQAAKDARTALAKTRVIGKGNRRDRRVSDEEIDTIIEHLGDLDTTLPMPDIVRFCLASGMRISEVCRLRWEDFDAANRTIVIRDRKHPTDKLGNDQTVPLLAVTGFDAAKIIERQARDAKRIFPVNDKTVGTYFRRAVSAAGIEDLHLHDLRHEAVSRLFAAGLPIQEVALVSGHRDWGMLRRYTHVKASDVHRSIAARTTNGLTQNEKNATTRKPAQRRSA